MQKLNVAKMQIVQMYDAEWPDDLRSSGHHVYALLLERFIADQDSIDEHVLMLRDFMAASMYQGDGS